MKKIIIVLMLFVVMLSGCSLAGEFYPLEYSIDIDTIEEALDYMKENLRYKSDGDRDYWQYESETVALGTGDCEDLAGVLAHLLIYNVGLKDVKLVCCIRKSDLQPHMMVKADGVYYEWVAAIDNYHDIYTTIIELSYSTYLELCRASHI